MNERDELAKDIYRADRLHKDDPVDLAIQYAYIIADELMAAGWTKTTTTNINQR